MKRDVLVVTFAISMLCLLQRADACSCRLKHPQAYYCDSDFVLQVRIKNERFLNDTRVFKVGIRKKYKMSEKAVVALKSGRLHTPIDDSVCGANLQVGKIYVISGRVVSLQAQINLCDFATPVTALTKRQRRGFKTLYKHGCICRIDYCKNRYCATNVDACNWTSDCETREGICLRKRNKSCKWTKSLTLMQCLKSERLPFLDGRDRKSGR